MADAPFSRGARSRGCFCYSRACAQVSRLVRSSWTLARRSVLFNGRQAALLSFHASPNGGLNLARPIGTAVTYQSTHGITAWQAWGGKVRARCGCWAISVAKGRPRRPVQAPNQLLGRTAIMRFSTRACHHRRKNTHDSFMPHSPNSSPRGCGAASGRSGELPGRDSIRDRPTTYRPLERRQDGGVPADV